MTWTAVPSNRDCWRAEPWMGTPIARGLATTPALLRALLTDAEPDTLTDPSLPIYQAARLLGWTDSRLRSVGHGQIRRAIQTLRGAVNIFGLSEQAMRYLLDQDVRHSDAWWQTILLTAPSVGELRAWDTDGWPSQENLDTLASLRRSG